MKSEFEPPTHCLDQVHCRHKGCIDIRLLEHGIRNGVQFPDVLDQLVSSCLCESARSFRLEAAALLAELQNRGET